MVRSNGRTLTQTHIITQSPAARLTVMMCLSSFAGVRHPQKMIDLGLANCDYRAKSAENFKKSVF